MTEEEMLKDNWIIGPLEKDNIINDLKIIDMSKWTKQDIENYVKTCQFKKNISHLI